jgi:hypothetical protein
MQHMPDVPASQSLTITHHQSSTATADSESQSRVPLAQHQIFISNILLLSHSDRLIAGVCRARFHSPQPTLPYQDAPPPTDRSRGHCLRAGCSPNVCRDSYTDDGLTILTLLQTHLNFLHSLSPASVLPRRKNVDREMGGLDERTRPTGRQQLQGP